MIGSAPQADGTLLDPHERAASPKDPAGPTRATNPTLVLVTGSVRPPSASPRSRVTPLKTLNTIASRMPLDDPGPRPPGQVPLSPLRPFWPALASRWR